MMYSHWCNILYIQFDGIEIFNILLAEQWEIDNFI